MNALIATPTAGETVTTAYVRSVVSATLVFNELGWGYRHAMFNSCDVVLARNYFASFFLHRPELTHLLFMDSDMEIEAEVFHRMVALDKPMVGAIYTRRGLDWAAYHKLCRDGLSDERARALASQFNVVLPSGEVDVVEGFCKVEGIGFGCVLLQRDLLQSLVGHEVAAPIGNKRIRAELGLPALYDFFGRMPIDDGDTLSEDYSFCRRVLDLGSTEIWALADTAIGHVGRHRFGAPFLASLGDM